MAVIWLGAVFAHSDFSLQKAQSSQSLRLVLLVSTALINARANYSLIKTNVSYFIRNHPFESVQMGVHRLVS